MTAKKEKTIVKNICLPENKYKQIKEYMTNQNRGLSNFILHLFEFYQKECFKQKELF